MYMVMVLGGKSDIERSLLSNLDRNEYYVTSVPYSPNAVERLGEFMPDIIILSDKSGCINSWELCRELRASLPVPVIIMGEETGEYAWVKTVQAGGDCYLKKPCGGHELAARVGAILRRYNDR